MTTTQGPPVRGKDGRFIPGWAVNSGPCAVETCAGKAEKRGLRGAHYRRWRIHGDVQADVPVKHPGNRELQIMGKVNKDAESGHWYRTGYIGENGYGSVNLGGRGTGPVGAHRAVYELLVGPIPAGHEPDHVCGVRHCVNVLDIKHVELVTLAENRRRGVLVREARRRAGAYERS